MATKYKPFDSSMFTATEYSTAEDKAKFGNHLLAFINADFPQAKFTKAFYNQLHNTFGLIAHCSQDGFWETYFTKTVDKVGFLKQLLEYPCYGSPEYTFSDVERAVRIALRASRMVARYAAQSSAEVEQAERRLLARLKAKYESDFFISSPPPAEVADFSAVQSLLF